MWTTLSSTSNVQIPGLPVLNTRAYHSVTIMNPLLRRLPVKPLLARSRCSVSKPLCSHSTDNATSSVPKDEFFSKGETFVIRNFPKGENFYSVDVDSMCDFTAINIVDEPLKTYLSGCSFVGSCNGLVCLWKPDDSGKDDIFLWNPTTREIKRIPEAINLMIPINLIGSSVVGFGYDHVTDDYKVMRTTDSQLAGIMVSVYSLKNNSWTRAETISNRIGFYQNFGFFANGSLHWLASNTDNIIAFDLGAHKHRVLPYPAGVGTDGTGLFVLNGCLGLLDINRGSHIDIWVMNNNGVESSWSKLLSIEQPGILGFSDFVYPVAFSKAQNEILLVVDDARLVWYDCETNKVRNIELHGFPGSFDMLVCKETLFQISDSLLDGRQSEEEEKKQREKTFRDYLDQCGFMFDDSNIERVIESAMDQARKKRKSFGLYD